MTFLNKIKQVLKKQKINFRYFLFRLFEKKPKVLSMEETIQLIIDRKLSVARFGDGEFRIMTNLGETGFQKYNFVLQDELIKSFNKRKENVLICSYDFNRKRYFNNPSKEWLKKFIYYKYSKIKKIFDFSYVYGNAEISRFYHPDFYKWTDFELIAKTYIPLLRKIWEKRNIIIVEGKETKLGLGNDLFNNCLSIRRIVCPSKDAFYVKKTIESAIKINYNNNDLVLVALGPTASIIATDLSDSMQIIDIGHIDVVYLWFLHRCKNISYIAGKYVNEANLSKSNSSINITFDESEYRKEIIDEIF